VRNLIARSAALVLGPTAPGGVTWTLVHTAVVPGGTGWGRPWEEGGGALPAPAAARRVTPRAAARPTGEAWPTAAGAHTATAPPASAAGAAATGDGRCRGACRCLVTPAVAEGSPVGCRRPAARSGRGGHGRLCATRPRRQRRPHRRSLSWVCRPPAAGAGTMGGPVRRGEGGGCLRVHV